MKIQKAHVNFVLEGIALAALSGLAATGLLMYFRLPPGSGSLELLGMGRHDWGDVHVVLAAAFVASMVVHLMLHWKWVWGTALGRDPAARRFRGTAFLVATALFVLLAATPWLFSVREGPGGGGAHRGTAAITGGHRGR